MIKKTDPFTRTPGLAGNAYIDNGIADEIIESFTDSQSAKYIFKITGIRGSGKSVEYGKVIRELSARKDWLVYTLSAAGDVISTLIAKLSEENFIDEKVTVTEVGTAVSVEGDAKIIKGHGELNVTRTRSNNEHYYSDEAILEKMIESANRKKYNVLIGIDDISKSSQIVKLLSMIGAMQLSGKKLYLLVTGLAENIDDFSTEKSLTFFKRADDREITGLSYYDISFMYCKLLGIDEKAAISLARLTNEYAYAYQVLGSLYFRKKENEKLEDLLPEFDRILFKDSYDLIWRSLTENEKDFIRCICRTKDGKAEEVKKYMNNSNSYSVLRARLMNKHVIDAEKRGYLTIKLPRFKEFVELWGDI